MTRWLILLILIFVIATVTNAQTTIAVPSDGNLQVAINTAKRGDRIVLDATSTYVGNFNLTDKGPCTGAESEFITITGSDLSGIPAALLGYPKHDVRITAAMAARMPKVLTPNAYPAFWINAGAACWRLKGLNISNTATSGLVTRLIGVGEQMPPDRARYPDRVIIEQNWIRPHEEDGSPFSVASIHRTAENAIYWEGTNPIIRHNAFQGFISDHAIGTGFSNLLITTWADNVTYENNLSEAWTYAFLIGGGGGLFADPAKTATVSNCTETSCVFSNVNGITVGMPVAVLVYTALDNIGVNRQWWGNAYVKSVVGSTVTVEKKWCSAGNDPLQNTCLPFGSNNVRTIPADGSQARWGGYQPQNINIRRNLFAHRDEWTKLLGQCGGKGYFELKTGLNITVEGNRFKGCDGVTITARNQTGADPWSALHGLRVISNYWENGNNILNAFLQDNRFLTARSRDVVFDNNLGVGQFTNPGRTDAYISVNFSGGENTRVTRNTGLIGSQINFSSFAPNTMTGLVMENNIWRAAINACWDYSSGSEVGAALPVCWPNARVNGNLLLHVDTRWRKDEIDHWWGNHYPNNPYVNSIAAVGFVAPDAGMTAAGNWRLRADSPYVGKGVNYEELRNALSYDPNDPSVVPSPIPQPTATPIVTPTPVPTATPTPQPTPTVSPTVTPTPVPSPPPSGTVGIQGYVYADGVRVGGAMVKVGAQQTVSRDDGLFWFDGGVVMGAVIEVAKDGYVFPSSVVVVGTVDQTYFISGRQLTQPSPTPTIPPATPTPSATPVSSPSPLPSPTIQPTPVPSPTVVPSPQPTPPPATCEMAIDAPTLHQWSTGLMRITINSPVAQSFTLTVTPDSGQLAVSPRSRSFSNVASVTATFALTAKKKSANVVVAGPCGSKTVLINVQ